MQIRRDDAVVHESTHELRGKPESRIPGEVVECTWGDDSGPYTLRGQVDDGAWVERSIASVIEDSSGMDSSTECVIAEGAYGRYGGSTFSWLVQDWCDEVPSYNGGCSFANEDA